jgi:hypothetical protein
VFNKKIAVTDGRTYAMQAILYRVIYPDAYLTLIEPVKIIVSLNNSKYYNLFLSLRRAHAVTE